MTSLASRQRVAVLYVRCYMWVRYLPLPQRTNNGKSIKKMKARIKAKAKEIAKECEYFGTPCTVVTHEEYCNMPNI